MPGGDGTGPMGMGPMTGRGIGYCAGNPVSGYANAGFGMGRGRGFRRMYFATGLPGRVSHEAYPYGVAPYAATGAVPEVDENEALKNQVQNLEKQLQALREQLKGSEETE